MNSIGVKLALAVTLFLSILPHRIESQYLGCSFQGLQFDKCLNQQGQYMFLEPCCRAINQALRVGFHCLCSVLATNAPQINTIFSFSLSSCYIMVPSLSMCRDLGTTPISLPFPPKSSSKEVRTAQQTPPVPLLPPPPPPSAVRSPLSPGIPSSSSSVEAQQQHPNKNVTSMLHVVENNANNVSSSGCEARGSSNLVPQMVAFFSYLFLGFLLA